MAAQGPPIQSAQFAPLIITNMSPPINVWPPVPMGTTQTPPLSSVCPVTSTVRRAVRLAAMRVFPATLPIMPSLLQGVTPRVYPPNTRMGARYAIAVTGIVSPAPGRVTPSVPPARLGYISI